MERVARKTASLHGSGYTPPIMMPACRASGSAGHGLGGHLRVWEAAGTPGSGPGATGRHKHTGWGRCLRGGPALRTHVSLEYAYIVALKVKKKSAASPTTAALSRAAPLGSSSSAKGSSPTVGATLAIYISAGAVVLSAWLTGRTYVTGAYITPACGLGQRVRSPPGLSAPTTNPPWLSASLPLALFWLH